MIRLLVVLLAIGSACGLAIAGLQADTPDSDLRLSPMAAIGMQIDTSLIGGYTQGSFVAAVQTLDSDLTPEERALLGEHLDRIFRDRLGSEGLERPGRLRIAYERVRSPEGQTRSIQVLGAEVAVGGRLHTFYHFQQGTTDGYFDPYGMPVDEPDWAAPLDAARISSPFGNARMHPILQRILPHTGVDLAAPRGRVVHVPADGIVSFAGDRGGYGLMVEVRHANGYTTRYAHLDAIDPSVVVTHIVRQGDVLGRVGMTGRATGPHLHYEVRRRGQPVDPMSFAARADLGGKAQSGPEWNRQRSVLTQLLARTPTISDLRASASLR